MQFGPLSPDLKTLVEIFALSEVKCPFKSIFEMSLFPLTPVAFKALYLLTDIQPSLTERKICLSKVSMWSTNQRSIVVVCSPYYLSSI